MKFTQFTTLTICISFLSGCFLSATKMYEGKELEDSQIAIIKGMDTSDPGIPKGWESFVVELDSKKVTGNPSYIKILPGKHVLKLSCRKRGTPLFTSIVELEAVAGAYYSIPVNTPKQSCELNRRR